MALLNEEDTIIHAGYESPCLNCGEMSSFLDLDFDAHFCSEECQKAKTDEFYDKIKGDDYKP
jgi:hypothetical protein